MKIAEKIRSSISSKKGLAFYRLPGGDTVNFLAGECNNIEQVNNDLQAFVVQPFLPEQPAVAIAAQSFFSFSVDEIQADEEFGWYRGCVKNFTETDYIQLVNSALQKINSAELIKAVPARAVKKTLQAPLNPLTFFGLLCRNYPQAFVSLVSLPNYGTWIGASPELLLKVTPAKIETVALAGTRKAGATAPFAAKEFAEQKLVEDFVKEKFTKLDWPVEVSAPQETAAGELRHLQTFFSAPLKVEWPQLLKLLHPTPAVCGDPADKAFEFLKENEGFERELYGGFLGPCNLGEQTAFFVNLRCMKFMGHEVIFYAGAGVVQGSDPHSEFLETEEKMKTLNSLMG